MPFIETTTSTQAWTVDSDGYSHTTRTFRVWGVSPTTFWDSYTQIPHNDAGNASRMPEYGDVIRRHVTPMPFRGNEGLATDTEVTLVSYRLTPVSAVLFEAHAEYTNSPHSTPRGQAYSATQHTSFVTIPFTRRPAVLPIGNNGADVSSVAYSPVESYVSIPMPVESISHTVSVQRGALTQVMQSILTHANELHRLPMFAVPCKFEGADVRLRGVDWLDVSYRWQYQAGIFRYSPSATQKRYWFNNNAWVEDTSAQNEVRDFPDPIAPLIVELGVTPMLLPPFHTIDLMWKQAQFTRVPSWSYGCPLKGGQMNAWQQMPGREHFIW